MEPPVASWLPYTTPRAGRARRNSCRTADRRSMRGGTKRSSVPATSKVSSATLGSAALGTRADLRLSWTPGTPDCPRCRCQTPRASRATRGQSCGVSCASALALVPAAAAARAGEAWSTECTGRRPCPSASRSRSERWTRAWRLQFCAALRPSSASPHRNKKRSSAARVAAMVLVLLPTRPQLLRRRLQPRPPARCSRCRSLSSRPSARPRCPAG
mmetsp:Transcript_12614/g.34637  ORF Transcript_12614/g.34637 Transcript_12614/m.34637 type:complete len:215 (-) Transcript_12614:268-912(-)